jgi:outer membrane biosynthesis protein TonB
VRDEIGARNMAIAKLQTGLDNKDVVIANLENKLIGAVAELKDRDIAIANLKSELEARENKQLTLFPGPEPTPEPEPIPTPNPTPEIVKPESTTEPKAKAKSKAKPEPTPEPIPITGTLTRGELLKYILEKFPDSGMEDHNIGDAVAGKTKRLSEFEAAYGFKYLGKIKGKNRFQLV